MQYDRLFAWYCSHMSVYPSVRLSVGDEVYCGKAIHPTGKVSEQVNRKCPIGTRFYNFKLTTPTFISSFIFFKSNSHLLIHKRWCHLANSLQLKLYIVCKRKLSAQQFQTTPYDRLFLSNSWDNCYYLSLTLILLQITKLLTECAVSCRLRLNDSKCMSDVQNRRRYSWKTWHIISSTDSTLRLTSRKTTFTRFYCVTLTSPSTRCTKCLSTKTSQVTEPLAATEASIRELRWQPPLHQ